MHIETKQTRIMGICLMLLCAVCLCAGQFIWKLYSGLFPLAVGFAIYAAGAMAMLSAYQFGSLSVLQPINSISYVISAILGYIFFHESITPTKILGTVIIIVGVILLAKGEKQVE